MIEYLWLTWLVISLLNVTLFPVFVFFKLERISNRLDDLEVHIFYGDIDDGPDDPNDGEEDPGLYEPSNVVAIGKRRV